MMTHGFSYVKLRTSKSELQFARYTQTALLLRIAGRPVYGKTIAEECHSCCGLGDRLCLPYEMHQTRTSPSNKVKTTIDSLLVAWVAWHKGETCSEYFNNPDMTVCSEGDVLPLTCNTAVLISTVRYHSQLVFTPPYLHKGREEKCYA
jgi:hypothetical protein